MSTTLAGHWSEFSVRMIPATVQPGQLEAMQLAFYFGALAAMNGCLVPGTAGLRLGEEAFQRLQAEACDFLRSDIDRIERRLKPANTGVAR